MVALARSNAYAALSHRYDRAHARFLWAVGGEAQCAFEGAVAALLRPGMFVLDVASGTGTVSRRLHRLVPDLDLTLLDASDAMLAQAADIPANRVVAKMEAMPLPPQSFDLVTCAWGIETLNDPKSALKEMFRVCRPGGHICLVFCADRPARSMAARVLKNLVVARGLGRFLDASRVVSLARAFEPAVIRQLHCTGPAAALLIETRKATDPLPSQHHASRPSARSFPCNALANGMPASSA